MSQALIQTEPAPVSKVAGDPPLPPLPGAVRYGRGGSKRVLRGTAQWHDHRLGRLAAWI